MINKKNVLGKEPQELGDKDAIHVAIVAVRAAQYIEPGTRCSLNEFNEAIPDNKGIGVADPFLKSGIHRGKPFWLLLNQDAVPNVRHVWEHPKVNFDAPKRPVQYNVYLEGHAKEFGITYEQLMDACKYVVDNDKPAKYPGKKTEEDCEDFDKYGLWSEWASETNYEFENYGSECCPEYSYPDELFYWE